MSVYGNETLLLPQCAARSVGPANQAFMQLIQTLIAAHCSLSSPDIWPKGHEPCGRKIDWKMLKFEFILCVFSF